MKSDEIRPGRMYRKGATRRRIASWGRAETYVVRAAAELRLPLGGVAVACCTKTPSFAQRAQDAMTHADLSRGNG